MNLSPRYHIQKLLGEGGMGRVFQVQDSEQNRQVALKVLRPELDTHSLAEEFRLLSRLSHPNLVTIYDYHSEVQGSCDDNSLRGPGFTMEFLRGQPLSDWGATVPSELACQAFTDAAKALHSLHSRNVLHRDIKPSNLFWTEGHLKLLDFGMAGRRKSGAPAGLGTPAYLPPEAFWGEYENTSDLFSLGASFYECLGGRPAYSTWPPSIGGPQPEPLARLRPDLPEFLCNLIHQLLALPPGQRLSSTAALLRALHRHGMKTPGEDYGKDLPSRLDWQKPVNLVKTFHRALKGDLPERRPFLGLFGPSGSGRSRLLEELRWEYQLAGREWLSLSRQEAPAWRGLLLKRFFGSKTPPPLLESLQRLLTGGSRRIVVLEDFHEWPDSVLQEIQLLLETSVGHPDSPAFIFDINSDWESPALAKWKKNFYDSPLSLAMEIPELSESEARNWLETALEKKPSEAWIRTWLEQSGGRPLLLIEALRESVKNNFAKNITEKTTAPDRLKESCRRRWATLSAPAKILFTDFLTRNRAMELHQVFELHPEEDWETALQELDQKSLLRASAESRSNRFLAQASLRPLYLAFYSTEEIRLSHARWLNLLKKTAPDPQAAGALGSEIAEHAALAGDKTQAMPWGLAAALYYEKREEPDTALRCYQRLVPFAEQAEERYVLQGSMAPLLHRLGRYDEAREAYALWFADRPDDATRLQKAKFHLFTGMVEYAAGKFETASQQFQACLAVDAAANYSSHRPYRARALNFLSALHKRNGHADQAHACLVEALGLTGSDPVLRGEIEQRLGELEQSQGRFTSAFQHFRRNLEYFQSTKNPQSTAVSYQLLALWAWDYGRLAEAELLLKRSLADAQRAGATLQTARYRQNLGLLHIDRAKYDEAWTELNEAAKILRVYGNREDEKKGRWHWGEFHDRLRNLSALQDLFASAPHSDLSAEALHLRALYALRTDDLASAEQDLDQALASAEAKVNFPLRIKLSLTRLSTAARRGRLQAQQDLLKSTASELGAIGGTLYPAYLRSLELWRAPLAELPGILPRFLSSLSALESPEIRRDLLIGSALYLANRGLSDSAKILWQMQIHEGRQVAAQLPEEMKMEYEKKLEESSLDEELRKILDANQGEIAAKPSASPAKTPLAANHVAPPPPPPPAMRGLSEQRFRQFNEIARQIAGKTKMSEVLERVMDAAIELTGAERGFLLLENPESVSGPLSGFEVKTARHFNQQTLGGEELQISMTAVRQAMERGSTLLSANAQHDERLKDKQSVVQYQLKSILAVPLELEGRVLGAIYLDHRYTPDCFREEDIVLLDSFSAQAALAIQKARFIADLKEANSRLEEKVETQAKRIEFLSGELAQVRDELRYGYDEIVGQSPRMMEVFHLLDHVSDTLIPVWIFGESGTGKELVARSLHENSSRKKAPLVTINCSAIPETLLESELFGHKRGAFTHADRDRVGLFEQANGGTMFMDEVADMSTNMQVKLLRVLQEGEVRPLGASKSVKVDVRLVTASNQDLERLVTEEKFRQDLFFRINGITIPLPPLRERKEDIPLLVNHLIQKLAKSFKLETGKLSEDAYEKLIDFSWPGNIRQLESVLRNALLFAQGKEIGPHLINLPAEAKSGIPGTRGADSSPRSQEKAEERRLIVEALRRHKMDKTLAAKDLGVTLRCLYMRMDRHGIPKNKSVLVKYLGLKV